MLIDCTPILVDEHLSFAFVIYGTDEQRTPIYRFFDRKISREEMKKLYALLKLISSKGRAYQHPEKFKPLSGKIWEMKPTKQLRIASVWARTEACEDVLVGFYAFRKKTDKWPSHHWENMKRTFRELPFLGT